MFWEILITELPFKFSINISDLVWSVIALSIITFLNGIHNRKLLKEQFKNSKRILAFEFMYNDYEKEKLEYKKLLDDGVKFIKNLKKNNIEDYNKFKDSFDKKMFSLVDIYNKQVNGQKYLKLSLFDIENIDKLIEEDEHNLKIDKQIRVLEKKIYKLKNS